MSKIKKLLTVRARPHLLKRTFVVLPQFQWRFILSSLIWIVFIMTLSFYLEAHLMGKMYQIPRHLCDIPPEGISADLLQWNKEFCQSAYFLKENFELAFLFKAFFTVVGFFLWSLYFTNRIAGPIVRVQRAMTDLLSGVGVSPLRIRKGDFLQAFVEKFNELHARKK